MQTQYIPQHVYVQPGIQPQPMYGAQGQVVQINPGYQQPMVQPYTILIPNPPLQNIVIQSAQTEQKPKDEARDKSGLQILDQESGIFVKQKVEMAEVALGCETENRYNVFGLDHMGVKKGRTIFKCQEKSGCLTRNCLSGDCRPFKMNISSLHRSENDDIFEPFLVLERPCKCTCLCFNRPYVKVTLVEGGKSEYIGKIVDPYNCCNIEFKIFDKEKHHRYTLEGYCCQLGFWCHLPCKPCQTIDFDIKLPSSGNIVSNLQKRTQGCLKAAFTDSDSFALNFPNGCTANDKVLLMCAILFLDYRHFETRGGK